MVSLFNPGTIFCANLMIPYTENMTKSAMIPQIINCFPSVIAFSAPVRNPQINFVTPKKKATTAPDKEKSSQSFYNG